MRNTQDWSHILPEITSALVLVSDRDLALTYVNPTAEDKLGYKADELIGEHIRVLVPPERQDGMMEFLETLTKAQAPVVVEHGGGVAVGAHHGPAVLGGRVGRAVPG